MSAAGLAAAILSSLCWSGLDATRKVLSARLSAVVVVVWLSLGQAPLFAAWAAAEGRWIDGPGYLLPGLGSTALQVAANLLFVRAVHLSPLSLSVPFLSLTPVFTTIVAVPMLGEHATALQWVGIVAVVAGALLINAHRGHSLLGALLREPGSVLMIGVAAIWSFTAALDKMALRHASVGAHATVQTGGVAVVLLVWLIAMRRLGTLRRMWPVDRPQAAAIFFAAGALGLQLLAFRLLMVGLVETLKRAVGVIASVAIGRVAFTEPITRPKVAAVVLMTVGTVLVTWT
ncbi:MAG: EamA family transporter [Myxococcota bacterium]